MFIDEVVITVKSGKGGDGSVAFRREKYVQFGGPDGGDGGKGGDIIFEADANINTLIDFQYKKMFKAQNGEDGQKKKMFGKNGEDLIIKVPVGTQIRDFESSKLILDMKENGMKKILLKGGRGGYGNVHFKSSTRRTPKIAEKGGEGSEIKIKMELKLIADVALVGYPSVGKSSLINKVSAANSKVGNYHFTTLEPKLGVVRVEEGKSFVIADIPGLIDGAHEGVGLGDKFLRHIERCKLIYHILDVAEIEGRDCIEDFEKINTELKKYSEKLSKKKQIVIANKMDLLWDMTNYEKLKNYLAEQNIEIFPVSVMLNEGLKEVIYKTFDLLSNIEREPEEEEHDIRDIIKELKVEKGDYEITRDKDGVINVGGRIVDDVLAKYVIGMDDESLVNFLHIMRNLGMEEALKEFGVENGDTVKIADVEFDYVE